MNGQRSPALVEGYEREAIAKIEVRRQEAVQTDPMAPRDPNIIAVASDRPVGSSAVPGFEVGEVAAIGDFVIAHFGLTPG